MANCPNQIFIESGTSYSNLGSNLYIGWNSPASSAKTQQIRTSKADLTTLVIQDVYGNAGTYNINIVPITGTIIGSSSITSNFGSITLLDTEAGWVNISSSSSSSGGSPGGPLNAIQFNNPLGTFDGTANATLDTSGNAAFANSVTFSASSLGANLGVDGSPADGKIYFNGTNGNQAFVDVNDGSASFSNGGLFIDGNGNITLNSDFINGVSAINTTGGQTFQINYDGSVSFANGGMTIDSAGIITTPTLEITGATAAIEANGSVFFDNGAFTSDGGGHVTANSFITSGGTSSQVVLGDGTLGGIGGYWTSSGTQLYNNTNSKVGINTTNPLYALDIVDAGSTGFDIGNTSTGLWNVDNVGTASFNTGVFNLNGFGIGISSIGDVVVGSASTMSPPIWLQATGGASFANAGLTIDNSGGLHLNQALYDSTTSGGSLNDVLTSTGAGATQWQPIISLLTNYWSSDGSNGIYNNNSANVFVGNSADNGSGDKLQVIGSADFAGQQVSIGSTTGLSAWINANGSASFAGGNTTIDSFGDITITFNSLFSTNYNLNYDGSFDLSAGNITGDASGNVGIQAIGGIFSPTKLTIGDVSAIGSNPSSSGVVVMGNQINTNDRVAFYGNDQSTSRTEFTLANTGDGSWTYNFLSLMVHGSAYSFKNYPSFLGNSTDAGKSVMDFQSNSTGVITEWVIGSPENIPISFFASGSADSNILATFNSDGAGNTNLPGTVSMGASGLVVTATGGIKANTGTGDSGILFDTSYQLSVDFGSRFLETNTGINLFDWSGSNASTALNWFNTDGSSGFASGTAGINSVGAGSFASGAVSIGNTTGTSGYFDASGNLFANNSIFTSRNTLDDGSGNAIITGKLTVNGPIDPTYIEFVQIATPSNPASGKDRLYFKSDNNLYAKTSAGTEYQVNGGGGGSGTVTSVAASSTGSTLSITGSPITTSGTINADLNLAHSNAWTATQTFGGGLISLASTTGYLTLTGNPGSLIGQLNINANGVTGALKGQSSINFENLNTTKGYFIGHDVAGSGAHNFFWYDRTLNQSPLFWDGDTGGTNTVYIGSAPSGIGLSTPGNVIVGGASDTGLAKFQITGNQTNTGTITATSFITSGGTSSQFVKGDGSLDSSIYSKAVSGDLTGQTAAVSSVVSVTSPNDGNKHTYRVGAYTTITAVATDVLNTEVTYTDETGTSRTQLFYPMGLTSANLATTGAYSFPSTNIRVNPNTAITVLTVLTTSIGTITYDVGGTIERLT